MSENTQNQNPQQEQYSLNDDRRVKVLSPEMCIRDRAYAAAEFEAEIPQDLTTHKDPLV